VQFFHYYQYDNASHRFQETYMHSLLVYPLAYNFMKSLTTQLPFQGFSNVVWWECWPRSMALENASKCWFYYPGLHCTSLIWKLAYWKLRIFTTVVPFPVLPMPVVPNLGSQTTGDLYYTIPSRTCLPGNRKQKRPDQSLKQVK